MKLMQLEGLLRNLDQFASPKIELEQYPTGPRIASRMLYTSDADYWLLSDGDVSITDMWRTDSGVEWNELGTIHEDYAVANVGTPKPQSPPPSATEVLPNNMMGR